MKNNSFCAFILSHGRPDNVITYDTLRKCGYTGKIYIIIDDTDDTADRYYERFGEDSVIMFDKLQAFNNTDSADCLGLPANSVVYARNECFNIANSLGVSNFIELDDDYSSFLYRTIEGSCVIHNLDFVFERIVHYLNSTPITCICFSQGGDHMGGFQEKLFSRKVMNSFICSVDKPFKFYGRINEDTTMYALLGSRGKIFVTIWNLQLNQVLTQTNSKGLTDIYKAIGTYVKSMYTVIHCPSFVKVITMGRSFRRLHHKINWATGVPCIIRESHKLK